MRVCPKCSKISRTEKRICRACGGILEEIPEEELAAHLAKFEVEPDPESIPLAEVVSSPAPRRPPLGLPGGSVRALLTLLIVAVVVVQTARGQEVELLWTETLMIALAHYFTSRRLLNLSPDLIRQLTAAGQLEAESQPLHLPRHSIRALILLAFVGLAVYLFQHGRLGQPQAVSLLCVVGAYSLGILSRAKTGPGWEDLKAGVVLAVMFFAASVYLLGRPDLMPAALRSLTLALALFYFGSR
jgi:hypothetical protein